MYTHDFVMKAQCILYVENHDLQGCKVDTSDSSRTNQYRTLAFLRL
jgi:hypothetical protein